MEDLLAVSGKSFALLLEPLRHAHISGFGGVIFRRELSQVKIEGGLWDESMGLYPLVNAKPNSSELFWTFLSSASIGFAGIEHEKDILKYQGAQITYIGFDELTHFTKKQFFYLLSRNRTTCGVRPYVRATTNPDKSSWVRGFINWWIYPKDHPLAGLPIPERSGVIRYFIVEDDKVIWNDDPHGFPQGSMPKSFTFISAKLTDNKILMDKDPGYLANLMAQSRVERKKLLDGNWDAEDSPGELFQRQWFPLVTTAPALKVATVRHWDRAASKNDTADWTVGLKLSLLKTGQFLVEHVSRMREGPFGVEKAIENTASQDGRNTIVGLNEDPGSAGKAEVSHMISKLSGFEVKVLKTTQDKVTHSRPVSSQAEAGNILVLAGPWNDDFFTELESFPEGGHDDQVDALSGAFSLLVSDRPGRFTDEMSEFPDKQTLEKW